MRNEYTPKAGGIGHAEKSRDTYNGIIDGIESVTGKPSGIPRYELPTEEQRIENLMEHNRNK